MSRIDFFRAFFTLLLYKSELLRNFLFWRYLITCFSCCNETFLLLLRFLPNLRPFRGSLFLLSLCLFVLLKKLFLRFFRFLLSSFQNIADEVFCYFYEFAILVEFVILALIYYFFYTSLQAVSIKLFLLKL